jgi:phosphate transport system substrate-binding protein
MNVIRNGISTTVAALAVVVVVVIVGAGVYVALNSGTNSTTTVTASNTSTTSSQGSPVTINGGGSSLVTPVMSIWSFTYGQVGNVNVNYQTEGSSAGIAAILAGTVNFGASDAPLQPAQYAQVPSGSTMLTIPETASAVIPAYNIPGVTETLNFTGDVLAKIFLGNISTWNDPALVALNPGATLPAQAIQVVHRSDGSGTMFAFTNYLSDANAFWKTHVGTGTLPNWPVGLGCPHNSGVASCISGTPYSIGPLEIAYQIENPGAISQGAVQNAAGNFILANLTNIASALNAGASGLPAGDGNWSAVSIINNIFHDTSAKGIYPITTFTYIMVYQDMGASAAHSTQAQATATVNFLWWVVNSGQAAGAPLGYPPLPPAVIALDDATINTITFNGTPIHPGS